MKTGRGSRGVKCELHPIPPRDVALALRNYERHGLDPWPTHWQYLKLPGEPDGKVVDLYNEDGELLAEMRLPGKGKRARFIPAPAAHVESTVPANQTSTAAADDAVEL